MSGYDRGGYGRSEGGGGYGGGRGGMLPHVRLRLTHLDVQATMIDGVVDAVMIDGMIDEMTEETTDAMATEEVAVAAAAATVPALAVMTVNVAAADMTGEDVTTAVGVTDVKAPQLVETTKALDVSARRCKAGTNFAWQPNLHHAESTALKTAQTLVYTSPTYLQTSPTMKYPTYSNSLEP